MIKRILLIIFCIISIVFILVGCAIRPFAFSGNIESDGIPTDSNGFINNVIFYDYFNSYEYIVVNGDGLNTKPNDLSVETPYTQFYSDERGNVLFSYKAISQHDHPNRNQYWFSEFSNYGYFDRCRVNFNDFKDNQYNNIIVKVASTWGSRVSYLSHCNVSFNIKFNLTEWYTNSNGNYVVSNNDIVIPVSYSTDLMDIESGYSVLRAGRYNIEADEYYLNDYNATSNPTFTDIYNHIQSDWVKLDNHRYYFSSTCDITDMYINISNSNLSPDTFGFSNVVIDYDIDNLVSSSVSNSNFYLEKESINVNIFQWISDAIQGFLDITIFGSITMGHLILTVIAIPILLGILKMIAGG